MFKLMINAAIAVALIWITLGIYKQALSAAKSHQTNIQQLLNHKPIPLR